ncbi:hypothetical protein CSKR_102775 [Clonorchis sinensis]|uniref:Uncharacterized protein n=1 Tax=Clonorchis sinensis TaxID=79923 RepID=A0A3R7H5R8_CLOSI|nr:hypothetical protein CSKR_102775 [Clonorchis sinensis]
MCCTRPPHVPVATIFEISRYVYIGDALLIRLLKILRQPTTGFALLGTGSSGKRSPRVCFMSCGFVSWNTILCVSNLLRLKGQWGARWPKWLEREFTDRKVRGSNPTSASRLPLSKLGQPGSIPAIV